MSSEIETKFAVDASCKPQVLAGLGDDAGPPASYKAIYFDTDNQDLRRHQVELRLQHSNGQIVQRIKARAHNGKIFACQSHKLVLSDLQPNIDHARASLPRIMRDSISLSALRPQFHTRFSRISHKFANAACATLTSFDEGYIEAAGRSELISEVEFELKGGRLGSYTEECLSFLDRVPAALLVESKAARGYRLASSELPCAVSAPHIVVPWNLSLPEAIMRILRHSFQHILDNHPAVTLSGAPESIHQMRVAMRRLRSAVRMFSPVLRLEEANGLLKGLRAFFSRLGEVREADVFIGGTLPSVTRAGLGEKLETVLRMEIAAFRDGIYREARGELTSPEFARLVIQLNDWIERGHWLKADRPIDALLVERATADFATPRIRALYAKLLKHASKAHCGTLEDWHRARIAAKKLRYAVEPLFGVLAPKIDTKRFSKQLSRLQTSLGHLRPTDDCTLPRPGSAKCSTPKPAQF